MIAIRPTREGGRSVYGVALSVPKDAHLVGAVGVNPKDWFTYPTYNTSYALEIVSPDGRREQLYTKTLKPHTQFDHRGWFDFDLSLADYAGQEVVLEFSTSAQLPEGESIYGGGWEVPRLTTRKANAAKLD